MLYKDFEKNKNNIINKRNKIWIKNKIFPKWVNPEEIDLEQFFTKEDTAKYCYNNLLSFLDKEKIDISNYTFVEPSAGNGAFFNLLDSKNKIGLDLMPLSNGILEQDFLLWSPDDLTKKYIFIGNPPFGYRAWLALAFMNSAAQYADYIGFILPMSFQSDGKGSPKNRVNNMKLVHSEILPNDSFYRLDNKKITVNALWQIWKKGNTNLGIKKSCDDWVDIFTVDTRKERTCGIEKMNNADFFLQRTYYTQQPKLVRDFSEVKYVCGYGIIIKKSKRKVESILNSINWNDYSNLATHNCRHISMYHIEKALIDRGIVNA